MAVLEGKLTQSELDLILIKIDLRMFERRYYRVVGRLYAELEEIEAQIAETEAHFEPSNRKKRGQATLARANAQETARTIDSYPNQNQQEKVKPTDQLKKLYREAALTMHPDLTTDERQRLTRQENMAKVNLAYGEGNEGKIQAILYEWKNSPESVEGEGTGATLVRIIRKIAQVEKRLQIIASEISELKASDFWQLMKKTKDEEKEGKDLLSNMANEIQNQISFAVQRLNILKSQGGRMI